MNAEPALQPTFDDTLSADDTPFSSRLRAVWLIGLSDPSDRQASVDDDGLADVADLVDVTPAFAWVS
jgi:hypothetical protein